MTFPLRGSQFHRHRSRHHCRLSVTFGSAEGRATYTMVIRTLNEFNFFAIASQSPISMGFSPSVKSTILPVQDGFLVRKIFRVSAATINPSIAARYMRLLGYIKKRLRTISHHAGCLKGGYLCKSVCIRLPNLDELGDMIIAPVFPVNHIIRFCTRAMQ